MAYILSTGLQEAEYEYSQDTVQSLIYNLFPLKSHEKKRLLPIFEHAQIDKRQFSASMEWFEDPHGLKERNELFHEKALKYAKGAIKSCLSNLQFLKQEVSPSMIDHIIFVSSTGINTPTLDTYFFNDLNFKETVKRTPMFGLGCAGGTSGVARAFEWLQGHPEKNVLVVCVELCSLTFQLTDQRVSNFVGTALFGDGASAVLMSGERSKLREMACLPTAKVLNSSSRLKPFSTDVMGWRVVDTGFEVIFNKSIPKLVKSFWSLHMKDVLAENLWESNELPFIVAHPGGRKVLEGYKEVFELSDHTLKFSENVLRNHGNMSSPTVHFVLNEAMASEPEKGTRSCMTSLGPGFSSEIVSLEWV